MTPTTTDKLCYIYIHVCCIHNYAEVFKHLIRGIKSSGLYDITKEIRCCVLGNCDESLFVDDKIKILEHSPDLSLHEAFTLNRLRLDSMEEEFNVLYLHTKGITRPGDPYVQHWVDYMCYFNIYRHAVCLKVLETNDTVGVNMGDLPECHYSGNFWWAKSSYIKKLELCKIVRYTDPEMWLLKSKTGRYACLWRSGCNHYHTLYPPVEYENKPIHGYIFDCT